MPFFFACSSTSMDTLNMYGREIYNMVYWSGHIIEQENIVKCENNHNSICHLTVNIHAFCVWCLCQLGLEKYI